MTCKVCDAIREVDRTEQIGSVVGVFRHINNTDKTSSGLTLGLQFIELLVCRSFTTSTLKISVRTGLHNQYVKGPILPP